MRVNSISLAGITNLAVLAPVKLGFVEGFEPVTYLERLRKLLAAMHASRLNQRESEPRTPVFPDSIGRFGIIQNFRYALVDPQRGSSGRWQLSLNVSFDGGWEPYMRVIYRDIGSLLDALFCHCDGYPGSTIASFDEYCRWVRSNEIEGGIFYADSSASPSDQRYLAEVERLARETPAADEAQSLIARLALPPAARQAEAALQAVWRDPEAALALPLRTLKGLYRLSTYFPQNKADDAGTLRRFARSLLQEFRRVIQLEEIKQVPKWPFIAAGLADELAWLQHQPQQVKPNDRQLAYSADALQAMMLKSGDTSSHGCVALLGVRDADAAAARLKQLADLCAADSASPIRHHVALTCNGLLALKIPRQRLEALPQEFIEGMEARCGLLGDVRNNHPDRWLRPLRYGVPADSHQRIDLSVVHVVVVLKLTDPAQLSHTLHPQLEQAANALQSAGSGLKLLALQPMRSPRAADAAADKPTHGHFGFADGLSQPSVVHGRPADPLNDEVSAGELLLGYRNDRGDAPYPKDSDALLDNASFMAMRKLRQRTDRIEAALGAHPDKTEVLEKMMGRRHDGSALVPVADPAKPNRFDYAADPKGAACPFQSHARRANPRDGRAPMPRLLRRGMSYGPPRAAGPQAERGIVFMGYCASLAEQFETIQRWLAGGNSSGLSSAQADPFLAVPLPGEKRSFRAVAADGRLLRADLGDKPFVELEWGLYLFVPSLHALRCLASFRARPVTAKPPPDEPPSAFEQLRRRIEDKDRSPALWSRVRAAPQGRLAKPPYGTLVGSWQAVLEVMKDDGKRYSVAGYGQRMHASVGRNHLGMDPASGHSELAPVLNPIVESIGEEAAFNATLAAFGKLRPKLDLFKQPDPYGPARIAVDLVTVCETVLAMLCSQWFGLPDGRLMVIGGRLQAATGAPRCPGHLLSPSRYIFAPHPGQPAKDDGEPQGQAVLQAVKDMLSQTPAGKLAPLSQQVVDRLAHIGDDAVRHDTIARSIAGLLLGFAPTVEGNFLRIWEAWIDHQLLWQHQQLLAEAAEKAPAPEQAYQRALVLRQPLLDTMRQRPVPSLLWRCPVVDGQPVTDDKTAGPIVLGIESAMTDDKAPHELMFGRDAPGKPPTLHGCPGYGMGLGVMLGLSAALLEAGSLRTTGSPVLLMLTPRAN